MSYQPLIDSIRAAKDPVSRIVAAILADVTDRRGWRQEFYNFDDDVRTEIIETWVSKIRAIVGTGEATDVTKDALASFLASTDHLEQVLAEHGPDSTNYGWARRDHHELVAKVSSLLALHLRQVSVSPAVDIAILTRYYRALQAISSQSAAGWFAKDVKELSDMLRSCGALADEVLALPRPPRPDGLPQITDEEVISLGYHFLSRDGDIAKFENMASYPKQLARGMRVLYVNPNYSRKEEKTLVICRSDADTRTCFQGFVKDIEELRFILDRVY